MHRLLMILALAFCMGFGTMSAQEKPVESPEEKAEPSAPTDIHAKRDSMTTAELMAMDLGQNIKVTSDIRYTEINRKDRSLDVYAPTNVDGKPVEADSKLPIVLFFHGGNWAKNGGDKRHGKAIASGLCHQGYVVISATYRGSTGSKTSMYPRMMKDAAAATHWVLENASNYGGDSEKLFLAGHSAGGHLAALLAYDESWLKAHGHDSKKVVKGLIGLSGIYYIPSNQDSEEYRMVASMLNQAFPKSAKMRMKASPIHHVDRNDPKTFIAFAENDMEHLDTVGIGLWVTLRAMDVGCSYMVAEASDHAGILRNFGVKDDATTRACVEFLNQRIKALE